MTKPVEDLFPPTPVQIKPFLNLCYTAIHELVCFGTHVIVWDLEKGKGKIEERNETALAPILLFRHILELLDGVSEQLKVGIVVPCKVQLRAILESYLAIEYMLEKDRNRRATCFLLVDHFRTLNFYKKLTPNTSQSEKFFKDINEYGQYFKNIKPIQGIEKSNKNQEELIQLPMYSEARREYLKLTKENTRNLDIKWYALFDGPTNVSYLAKRLKKYDIYEFFYRSWSDKTHGTNLANKVLVKGDDGNGAITQLRNIQEAHEVVTQTIGFALLLFNLMAKKVVSDHRADIYNWQMRYKEIYRDPIDRIKLKADFN